MMGTLLSQPSGVEPHKNELPPDPLWIEAAERLEISLHDMDDALQENLAQWREEVEREVTAPLRKTVRRVAERHRSLISALDLDQAESGRVLSDRTAAYLQAVVSRVLTPLAKHISGSSPATECSRATLELLNCLANIATSVPSESILPEPTDLFQPKSEDPWHVRFTKIIVRSQRQGQRTRRDLANQIRKVFNKPLRPHSSHGHAVPARSLFDYHLRVRLPNIMRPAFDEVQRIMAHDIGALSVAITSWTHDLLEAEELLDDVRFHLPERFASFITPTESEDTKEHGSMPSDPSYEDVSARIRLCAEGLQQALNATALLPPEPFDEALFAQPREVLVQDLECGGTLVATLRKLPNPLPADQLSATCRTWEAWFDRVHNRWTIEVQLLAFRARLVSLENSLLRDAAEATLGPVTKKFVPMIERLRMAKEKAESMCEASAADLDGLSTQLLALQEETTAYLERMLREIPGLVASDQILSSPGQATWQEMRSLAEQLPGSMEVHLPAGPDASHRVFDLNLRHIVGLSLNRPLPERLRPAAEPFRRRVVQVWGETENVMHIVQYNLDAAQEELTASSNPVTAMDEDEAPPPDPLSAARELTTDGLGRAANTLSGLSDSLHAPWAVFADAVCEAFRDDWSTLHSHFRASGKRTEQWVGVRAWFDHRQIAFRRSLTTIAEASIERIQKVFRLSRRRAQLLIKQGQSAVGVADEQIEGHLQTLDAITNVEALQKGLPLIYRKLFSFDPLTEPSLLENRTRDLVRVRRHFERWKKTRQGDVLILPSPPGSGRTSFLNAVRLTALRVADVRMAKLETRFVDESHLVACLSETLGLPKVSTFDDLEAVVLSTPRPEPPVACLIDNLELAVLRAPDGSTLIERLLISLSRTDTRIYWIATVSSFTWQFLRKTLPATTGLATVHEPARLDRNALEALIMNRHRRSGMPLRFDPPGTPVALKRHLFRRTRTEEDRQRTHRQVFFDQLFKISGQNIMLALFYWLRSSDFEAADDALTLHPAHPLSFNFFASFDLDRAFTLKAFLIHGSLTLVEHNKIFRMSEAEGTFILESLLNQRIIGPSSNIGEGDAPLILGRIVPGARYRIHPLLLHPLIVFLRGKHIIY